MKNYFLLLIFSPFLLHAGTSTIHVNTEGWGTITNPRAEVLSTKGSMFWNGSKWVSNETWAHLYFTYLETGQRIKPPVYIDINARTSTSSVFDTLGYHFERQIYSYSDLAKEGGSYRYEADQYQISLSAGKRVVLQSRGTGNGKEKSYFNIYVEDTTNQITAIRNDPQWFTYEGMSLESALQQSSPTQYLTGSFISTNGYYFMDINSGADLGGVSYIFHTDTLTSVPKTDVLGLSYPIDFGFRIFVPGSGNVVEFRFQPKLLSEQFIPANGTGNLNKEPEWVRYYESGQDTPSDQPSGMATDKTGNVYIAGRSEGYPFSTDYLTLKYDPQGKLLWSARYNNGGNDEARALALDDAGNVYITGMSFNPDTYYDIVTIKYSQGGEKLWQATYNGTGNLWDEGRDILVDPSGNVYVTGRSESAENNYDMVTIKYNASGTEQWVKRYSGTAGLFDGADAIAMNSQGNLYVVGYSGVSETAFDFVAIQYAPDGTELWVRNNSAAGNSHYNPVSAATDVTGNLIVAGTKSPAGQFSDFITIKYSTAGSEMWVKTYNGTGNSSDGINGVVTDGTGNVYVTGYSQGAGTGYDFATVKYNSSGTEVWAKRYNLPGAGADYGADIITEAAGNIVVSGYSEGQGTGYDYATVKYKPDGTELWVKRYNHSGESYEEPTVVRSDDKGNIFVCGYSIDPATGPDFATVKYNSEGNELWVRRFNGTGNSQDLARAIAADKSGNAYVTGSSDRAGTGQDFITLKYDSQGKVQWLARYNGPANSFDQAAAVAVDSLGNVYITGASSDGNSNDYATVKYNPVGIEQWVRRYNGTGNSFDNARAIAVDRAGNVYITGSSTGTALRYDYTTIKYNSSGTEQWVKRYNGPGNVDDEANAIALDENGNVYITGTSGGTDTRNDYCTIKYNKDGSELWVKRYNGPSGSFDYASDIALDKAGNVIVTGHSPGSGTSDDFATVKYNSSGVEQWVKRYNGPANSNDIGKALNTDVAGNVYVTGYSTGTGSGYDYTTIRYTAEGAEQWVRRYNGLRPDSDDQAGDIAIDDSSYVYVTGLSRSFDNRAVVPVTIRYTPQGTESWVARFNNSDCYYGFNTNIAVSGAHSVFVSTSILNDNISWSIYATLKYSTGPQANPELKVTPQVFTILPDAVRTASVSVSTNTTWRAVADKPWVSLNPSSGSGNETVVITTDSLWANPSRTAKVTFTATGVTPQTVKLTQEAATLSVSGNTITMGYSGGSVASFTISSNSKWTIDTGQSWLTANPATGTGNKTITLTAQANTLPNNRNTTVTISAPGTSLQTIQVTQSINTAIRAEDAEQLLVYPNPFADEINVHGIKTRAVLTLRDITGRVLLNKVMEEDGTIGTHSLPAGMYMLKVVTGDGPIDEKLIKK
jgi:uncharacterized delta-60 repeat protein